MRLFITDRSTILVIPEIDLGEVDQSDYECAMADEPSFDQVSQDVKKVVEHLNQNRTTKGEARELRDAADKSIRGHDLVLGIGNIGGKSED